MYNFRVLNISSNLRKFPDSVSDTTEFPFLIDYLEGEQDLFVYCLNTGEFHKAKDFFYDINVRSFETEDFN